MIVHRGRAFARAWPREYGDETGKAALVGIAEVSDPIEDDGIHGLALTTTPAGISLTSTGVVLATEYDHGFDDIDALLRHDQWPRPVPALGLDGGGVAIRRTRAPASPGLRCVMLIALLSTDAIADETMVDIHGDTPGVLHVGAPDCARHLDTRGTSMSQILKKPIWGWDEPWGFVSTLRLESQDDCRRLEALMAGADEHEPGERERLERGGAGSLLGLSRRHDGDYGRFREEWLRRHGPGDWSAVLTAAQMNAKERLVGSLIREMFPRAA